MKHQDTRRKLLIWALVLLLLPLLFQPAEARAAHDELLTGLIDGKAFRFSLDALQSRTACLLVYQDGKRSDLLQFRHREKVYTASLTKIMTAYLAYELMEAKGRTLDDRVPVRAVDLDGLQTLNASVAGFQDGESVSFRDLFYGLLIGSGCDAANTLARVAAGSADEFLLLMNEKAKTLGLSDSSYANPTGLFDAGNYGTAEDVAVLLARTLENPFLHEVLMARRYTTQPTRQHPQGITLRHYLSYYSEISGIDSSPIDGGKTGQLKESGYCLASFKEIRGLTFILCTTGADLPGGHLADHAALYSALSDQLPEGDFVITGIGEDPRPPDESKEGETGKNEKVPGEPKPGGAVQTITLVFLGILALLALLLFLSLLLKRRIGKEI